MKKQVAVIGSGFSAMAASCYLAKAGFAVSVFEKNKEVGGRASRFKKSGFVFDMGPTWYWMPDVFERFFADFNLIPSSFYELEKLDPAYKVYFENGKTISIGDSLAKIMEVFEAEEPGSSKKLQKFIDRARKNYDVAIKDLVYRPGVSPMELVTPKTLTKLKLFYTSIAKEIRSEFKNEKLVQILEFPVLFLGARPADTPAFYNFMNYADFGLGTWHPLGGMYQVVLAMKKLAESMGVRFYCSANVEEIHVEKGKARGIVVNGKHFAADVVLSGADYHHTESLLPKKYRQYSEKYWESKTFAPSSLLFYVGFDKKLDDVTHHSLFFDSDFEKHADAIYSNPKWPEDPLFYASFPSVTDASAAPDGQEAGIFLIPLAPGIEDTPQLREQYFKKIISRFEKLTGQQITEHILFKESFCVKDFISRYNSYKGNAYGLANTLFQTAFLRPKLRSKKVGGLYFTGQLTVPGPGVPPALISGKLASGLIEKDF